MTTTLEERKTKDLREQAIENKVPYARFMKKAELIAALRAANKIEMEAVVEPVKARIAKFPSTLARKDKPRKPKAKAGKPEPTAEAKGEGEANLTLKNLKGADSKFNGVGIAKTGNLNVANGAMVNVTTDTGVELRVRRYCISG